MAKAYKKQSLGRGLSEILSEPSEDINSAKDKNAEQIIGNIIDLPLQHIKANPFQPRTNFENEKIKELAESIDQLGIIQPITVRKTGFKNFEIISGERRYRAAQYLKLKFDKIKNKRQIVKIAINNPNKISKVILSLSLSNKYPLPLS